MPLHYSCLTAISRAYRATPTRNLEVEVGVPPLGIDLDSIQARFRVRLEESEAAGAIREAVQKVERWIGCDEGQAGGRGRRRAERGGPPVAPPRKLQLPPTKANFPGPYSGFQMTIPTVH
jgi:hypothetical protein